MATNTKLKKIILLILLITILSGFFIFLHSVPANAEANWQIPDLQIKIPGMEDFSTPKACADDSSKTCVPWIGQYIAGIYKYAIGIVGILAALILMVGGVIWITAGGNQTRVGEAKAWIGASLTGLLLALCSYLILYQVNPKLTQETPIRVNVVSKIELNDVKCCSVKKGVVPGFTEIKDGKSTQPNCKVPDDKKEEYGATSQFSPKLKKCEKNGDTYGLVDAFDCTWEAVGTINTNNDCSSLNKSNGEDKNCTGQAKPPSNFRGVNMIIKCCCKK